MSTLDVSPTTRKVFRIIARLSVGGPAIHTVLLTQRLNPQQFCTHLLTGIEGPTEGSMRYLAEECGVEPTYLPTLRREISWRDDVKTLLQLIALMRREKPDIIHTHTAKAGTLGRLAALLALAGRPKRLYHTFHGHVFHSYFSPRKTQFFLHIERFLARYTDRLIAVSERTREELIAYGVAPPEKIIVIPLGLDLDPFARCEQYRGYLRQELGLGSEAILIGVVARLVPVKGLHLFLEAAQKMAASVPNAHFLLIGDGELRAGLEAQAHALGLTERVHFLGFRADLPRLYADLDIVALSSLNEGLPVSLIEAMASGKVVVSTSVGGVPNLIVDGETGYLAPPQDANALAQTLCCALKQRADWPRMGAAARRFALSHFHITRLVSDIEALYDDPPPLSVKLTEKMEATG